MKTRLATLKSIYVVGEIEEPELFHKVNGQNVYFLFSILGILLYFIAMLIYLFSAGIMSIPGLREDFANWGFLSLAVALLFFFISKFLRNHGFSSITNEYQHYTIKTLFGKYTKISKPEIFANRSTRISVISRLILEAHRGIKIQGFHRHPGSSISS